MEIGRVPEPVGYTNQRSDSVEERKRIGKEALAEVPQRKKGVRKEDTAEFIKTLKRSKYSVVKHLKNKAAQISVFFL